MSNEPIKNRYEFIILFDVENGNPNGDPDAGNMPRIDPETGVGLVTDVCLKRKIRNYVETVKENSENFEERKAYKIYIKKGTILNNTDESAYKELDINPKDVKKLKKDDIEIESKLRDFMCRNYFDIRTFGAVLTGFVRDKFNNAGQIRGPVQLGFAHSIDTVVPQEVTISRVTVTTVKEVEENKSTMFGQKYIIPYGLYRTEGHVSANLAQKSTGFSEKDLELLWEAIINMFEHDYSAARGKMIVRELIVFKHESDLGNAPSHKLFDLVTVQKNTPNPPRAYSDYDIIIDEEKLPAGITLTRMV